MVKRIIGLFSIYFSVLLFAFFGDLFLSSSLYISLDSLSISVSHQIAMEGKITQRIINFVENSIDGAHIEDINIENVEFGGIFMYRIYCQYESLIFSDAPFEISITRGATIGYLGL